MRSKKGIKKVGKSENINLGVIFEKCTPEIWGEVLVGHRYEAENGEKKIKRYWKLELRYRDPSSARKKINFMFANENEKKALETKFELSMKPSGIIFYQSKWIETDPKLNLALNATVNAVLNDGTIVSQREFCFHIQDGM